MHLPRGLELGPNLCPLAPRPRTACPCSLSLRAPAVQPGRGQPAGSSQGEDPAPARPSSSGHCHERYDVPGPCPPASSLSASGPQLLQNAGSPVGLRTLCLLHPGSPGAPLDHPEIKGGSSLLQAVSPRPRDTSPYGQHEDPPWSLWSGPVRRFPSGHWEAGPLGSNPGSLWLPGPAPGPSLIHTCLRGPPCPGCSWKRGALSPNTERVSSAWPSGTAGPALAALAGPAGRRTPATGRGPF